MNGKIHIAIISAIIGALICYWLLKPEIEVKTEIKETIKTDTVFITLRDTIRINRTEIKHEYLRDTILIDFKPKISLFKTSKSFLYGNTHISGEVLGEVLKMDITNDFKIPQVTNTITRTEKTTIKEKPKGFYLGLGVNNQLSPFGMVNYLDNQFIFSYQYQPFQQTHSVGVSKRLF